MKSRAEIDMTKGSPLKLISKFAIPLVIGNIFQQLYNMADTIIVGRFVGRDALAAVGSTGTIMFLIIGFMQGLTAGFTVVTAQRFGAGDYDNVKRSFCMASILGAVLTLLTTILSVTGMEWLLRLMNTPDDIFEQAHTYITIICMGLVFNILYNLMASFLRAVGNSKMPLYFLLLSATTNVVLDLFFVISFDMGVAGAALATVVSQGLSGILCLIYILLKVPVLSPAGEHWKLDYKLMGRQLGIGFPMALQFSVTAIGTIMVQSALNTLGSLVVAAYTAASKVEQLVTQPFMAMGMTMATYGGQNRGVNDFARIRKGVKVSLIMTTVYAIVVGLIITNAVEYLIPLFTDENLDQIIPYAQSYVNICAMFFVPLGAIFPLRNVMQGMGFALIPMMGGVIELFARAITAKIAEHYESFEGICCANVAAWLSAAVFLLIMYTISMKKIKKREQVM